MAAGIVTMPASNTRGLDVWGHSAVSVFDYTGPTAYVAGGEAVTPGQVKLGTIEYSMHAIANKADFTDAVIFKYHISTGKIGAYWGNGAAASQLVEVTAGTDLSPYTGRMMAMGKG